MYEQDTDACFGQQPGSHGISRERIDALLDRLSGAYTALKERRDESAAPLLATPLRTDDLAAMEALAARIRSLSDTVVVAGTGGSGLSGRTLASLKPLGSKPALHFLENIDPDGMDEVLAHIDCRKTCFLVISKSGTTAETLAQFFVLFGYAAEKLGKKTASERFFVITLPGDNLLRRLAGERGIEVIDHDAIGGRFSILTNVGLLPAAIAGLDIRALRHGAKMVIDQMDRAEMPDCPPAYGAALNVAFIEKNIPMSVMLPYSQRLAVFSTWWRQGWAESLGKQGKGSTPVVAIGTTDQHSQLQLYLDGPADKLFTMLMLKRNDTGRRVEDVNAPDYMRGRTLGDIMAAEQQATFETLTRHYRPVRVLRLTSLKEEEIGALLMHFMLEIVFTGRLLGVNPFDQPAVEEGKKLARDYLLAGDL